MIIDQGDDAKTYGALDPFTARLGLGLHANHTDPVWKSWDQPRAALQFKRVNLTGWFNTVLESGSSGTEPPAEAESIGTLTLGGYGPSHDVETVNNLSVKADTGKWLVECSEVFMKGPTWAHALNLTAGAINLNPSMKGIGLPAAMIESLMTGIDGAHKTNITLSRPGSLVPVPPIHLPTTWILPCSSSVNLTFALGDQKYSLDVADWTVETPAGSGNCSSLLTESDDPYLGMAFFRTVHSFWDFSTPSVGLAKSNDEERLYNEEWSRPDGYNVSYTQVSTETTDGRRPDDIKKEDSAGYSKSCSAALVAVAVLAAVCL